MINGLSSKVPLPQSIWIRWSARANNIRKSVCHLANGHYPITLIYINRIDRMANRYSASCELQTSSARKSAGLWRPIKWRSTAEISAHPMELTWCGNCFFASSPAKCISYFPWWSLTAVSRNGARLTDRCVPVLPIMVRLYHLVVDERRRD